MGDKARDHREDGRVGPFLQPQHTLERRLIRLLSGKVIGRIRRCEALVARRVIALHVDAVEHAVELARVHAHHVFQPVGKVRVLELLRVGRAHGGHGVCRDDRAL